jgi:hypothetical protein
MSFLIAGSEDHCTRLVLLRDVLGEPNLILMIGASTHLEARIVHYSVYQLRVRFIGVYFATLHAL